MTTNDDDDLMAAAPMLYWAEREREREQEESASMTSKAKDLATAEILFNAAMKLNPTAFNTSSFIQLIADALERARLEERIACAQIAEDWSASEIAAAIRGRL